MTHPLGSGTCNLNINLPIDEKAILGQAAFNANAKSVGDFVKKLLIRGLTVTDPEAAAKVRGVRRQYYGAVMLFVFLAALICGERMDLRRTGRRTRTEEQVEECA